MVNAIAHTGKGTFQSTLPTRGSDAEAAQGDISMLADFNPRSPRGGATGQQSILNRAIRVSIHAPHEGERLQRRGQPQHGQHVSIHAPHEGERPISPRILSRPPLFQSTLPTRGSDRSAKIRPLLSGSVSIHAPHEGERPCRHHPLYFDFQVSIHAPHEGERPSPEVAPMRAVYVSIHAPHEGERLDNTVRRRNRGCFNPRSPRGGAT